MKTKMTEMCGIKHPIMLAAMAYVSLPKLVAAVSNAGGLGMFNSAANTPKEMRAIIKEIRSLTDKPFGVNATLLIPNSKENMEVALEEKVPVLNYSLGKGDWIIKAAHEYGGKVLATVAMARHAKRAEQDGADGLIVTGYEAAAHGEEPTSLVLIPYIASLVKIPVMAAGGFSDGKGLAAALVLGAEGISMGTRFYLSKECESHEAGKQAALKATIMDTFRSAKIDGLPGRFLISPAALKMDQRKMIPLGKAISGAFEASRTTGTPLFKLLLSSLKQRQRGVQDLARQAINLAAIKVAVETGDLEHEGVLPIGQIGGRIENILTCKEIIEGTVAEAEAVIKAAGKKFSS